MPFEQLALNLTETEAPTLENFDADGNREAVAALAACRAGTGPQFICLWGRQRPHAFAARFNAAAVAARAGV